MTVSESGPLANRTICVPFIEKTYEVVINDAIKFREYINPMILCYPEIFPENITVDFTMKDIRESIKMKMKIRRILIGGIAFSIRPSFVMPYMTGKTKDVEKALFLRKFAVPFWALSYCYGRNPMYWYRIEASPGRNSLVGTTIKSPDNMPQHPGSDEKHARPDGDKIYIACTVGNGCVLGADISGNANLTGLEASYGRFKDEAPDVKLNYSPKTINTDGWKATINALKSLFPLTTLIACFLHIFISIRDRASKKFKAPFRLVAGKLKECYRAESEDSFSQQVRRLNERCQKNSIPSAIADKINKLSDNLSSFSIAYNFPGAHRASNMIDRLMRRMNRFLVSIQWFHGEVSSANLSIRAWALIQNFAPFNPYTVSKNDGIKSPAEKLNGFRYHENWLENLQISASMGDIARLPKIRYNQIN